MDTEILRKLEARLGPLHARQRLGAQPRPCVWVGGPVPNPTELPSDDAAPGLRSSYATGLRLADTPRAVTHE